MKRLIVRALNPILQPLFRRILPKISTGDPWERVGGRVLPRMFGPGSRRDFGWYFEGQSLVRTGSLEDVVRWLSDCEYASDMEVFQERDFWQHPRTFERLRRGDCEDFALWAWRKLIELGYEAEFVVGRCEFAPRTAAPYPAGRFNRHAWVMFADKDVRYLFEPTLRDRELAVRPLDVVRAHYVPEFGVDAKRVSFAFNGYLQSLSEAQLRPRSGE